MRREEYTNQHGAKVPTETTAVIKIEKESRKRVRAILRQWGKTDRELERLEQEYLRIVDEINALRGLQAMSMDGMPHGNKITHPTEDSALAVMAMMDRRQERLAEIIRKIAEDKKFLARIECVMVVAKNANFLRRNYHDCVRPMAKLAEEFHVSEPTAWRMENEGIDSIANII